MIEIKHLKTPVHAWNSGSLAAAAAVPHQTRPLCLINNQRSEQRLGFRPSSCVKLSAAALLRRRGSSLQLANQVLPQISRKSAAGVQRTAANSSAHRY